ncbi:MAG: histidine phosphatase family protein [Chloroflexota bacterium]
MSCFILVRHGQTEWNREERFRGRVDLPLNPVGVAQAEAAARRIADNWRPAAVYSSPLERARQTALAIGRECGLPVTAHQGLLDMDYGQWQGKSPALVAQEYPELYRAWREAPYTLRIPGGESLDDVRRRVLHAVEELTVRHPDQAVVLVSHVVVNRVLLGAVLGLGDEGFWSIGQDTGAINVFESTANGFVLLGLNDTCHLVS